LLELTVRTQWEVETTGMQGHNGERWRELCEQAAKEKDANRLIELILEINRMLSEKEERLKNHQ